MKEWIPEKTSVAEVYKLITSLYIPRPIAWVSTLSLNNIRNLAPFSFSMVVAVKPLTIVFAPMYDIQRKKVKDTIINLRENPDCVIHLVTMDLVEKMNLTSAEVPLEVDEFELAQLTPVKADLVNAYRVKEAKVAFEARAVNMFPIGELDGSSTLVLTQVKKIHISESIWNSEQSKVDIDNLQMVGRMGEMLYCRTTDRFELKRPKNL